MGTGETAPLSVLLAMYAEVANPQDSFVLTKDCRISLLGSQAAVGRQQTCRRLSQSYTDYVEVGACLQTVPVGKAFSAFFRGRGRERVLFLFAHLFFSLANEPFGG